MTRSTMTRSTWIWAALAAATAAAAAIATTAGAVEGGVHESSIGALQVTPVAGPFEHPWALAHLPGGAVLVTERPGRMRVISPDGAASPPVAGLPTVYDGGQGGLLDVALAPDHATSGVLFFAFAEPVGRSSRTAVARARLVADDPAAPRLEEVAVIFQMEPAIRSGYHFGARIVVDRDGALFVTLGERGERDLAQDLTTHMGKVIRIAPTGGALPDNPFANRGDALPEIWSLGHRNPQGATLDPLTGEFWTVEHGPAGGDELNKPRAGRNYGWPRISFGRHYSGGQVGVGTAAPGLEQPEFYWDPSIAPSGLMIYDGAMFPEWRGDIFVGALKFELITRLDRDADGRIRGEERLFAGAYGRVRDLRAGPDGAIWFVTDEPDGFLYRVSRAQ